MGKSRYEPLVKLKKRSLDEAERDLIAANNALAAAAEQLHHAYETLRTLSLPSEGTIREFSQANMMVQTQHETILRCNEALEKAQHQQHRKREIFNRTMIEFEKFNYLEVQEMNAKLKQLKDQEAKMLDEIGTMTHKREKK